jgi:hypothetical protein
MVLGDPGICQLGPDRREPFQGSALVGSNQPRIAGDIGSEDRHQPPLDPLFAQRSLPAPRKPPEPAIASLCASGVPSDDSNQRLDGHIRMAASWSTQPADGQAMKVGSGSTAAVRERPGKRRLLARQRRDSGRHPSGSHQGWSGHTSAQPVHASSKMSYAQSTFV